MHDGDVQQQANSLVKAFSFSINAKKILPFKRLNNRLSRIDPPSLLHAYVVDNFKTNVSKGMK
jgi:hypothetical protein